MRAKTAQGLVKFSHLVLRGAGVFMGLLFLVIPWIDLRAREYVAPIVPLLGTFLFFTRDRSGSERALWELTGKPSENHLTVLQSATRRINVRLLQLHGVSHGE